MSQQLHGGLQLELVGFRKVSMVSRVSVSLRVRVRYRVKIRLGLVLGTCKSRLVPKLFITQLKWSQE